MNEEKKQLYVFGYGLALLIPMMIGMHTVKPFLDFWPFVFCLLGGFAVVMFVITKAANIKPVVNIWMFAAIELSVVIAVQHHAGLLTYIFALMANVVLAVTVVNAGRLRPVYKTWMRAANAVGSLITHLVLALVYFVMFAPAGIVLRILKKDIMHLRKDEGAASFWIKREKKEFVQSDCLRQF